MLHTGTNFNDLYSFSPSTLRWANLTSQASGNVPEGVSGQGFVSFQGFLYLFGGLAASGLTPSRPLPHCASLRRAVAA